MHSDGDEHLLDFIDHPSLVDHGFGSNFNSDRHHSSIVHHVHWPRSTLFNVLISLNVPSPSPSSSCSTLPLSPFLFFINFSRTQVPLVHLVKVKSKRGVLDSLFFELFPFPKIVPETIQRFLRILYRTREPLDRFWNNFGKMEQLEK